MVDTRGGVGAPRPLLQDGTGLYDSILSNAILEPVKLNGGGMDDFRVEPFKATAAFSFNAEMEEEVSFDIGAVIEVLAIGGREDAGEGWWYGNVNGVAGWFPAAFVKY